MWYRSGPRAVGFLSRLIARRVADVQVMRDTVWTKVEFNGVAYDKQSEFDPVNKYRFTAMSTGGYTVATNIRLQSPGIDKEIEVELRKNGVDSRIGVTAVGTLVVQTNRLSCGGDIKLVRGDYLEVYVRHNGGSDTNLAIGSQLSIHQFV